MTGFFVKLQNLTELKEVIASAVMKQLDHKNIDVDVDFFRVREKKIDNLVFPQLLKKINLKKNPQETRAVSTTENLAVYIWKCLRACLKEQARIQIQIFEFNLSN